MLRIRRVWRIQAWQTMITTALAMFMATPKRQLRHYSKQQRANKKGAYENIYTGRSIPVLPPIVLSLFYGIGIIVYLRVSYVYDVLLYAFMLAHCRFEFQMLLFATANVYAAANSYLLSFQQLFDGIFILPDF